VCLHWFKILYQVGIAAEVVFTVGGVYITFELSHQQLISFKQLKKTIPSHGDRMLLQKRLQLYKKLSAPTSWLQFSYSINLLQDHAFLH